MTAIKRCCALALAVLMILTALPVTAFAQAAEQEVNASLQETTVSGIANDIARQVLRSGQKNGEKIQMENTAKLDDSDEVEIIVVVNDSVADPDSRAQVNALLRTQKSAPSPESLDQPPFKGQRPAAHAEERPGSDQPGH